LWRIPAKLNPAERFINRKTKPGGTSAPARDVQTKVDATHLVAQPVHNFQSGLQQMSLRAKTILA